MHSVSINDFVRQISAENRRSRVSSEDLDLRWVLGSVSPCYDLGKSSNFWAE